MKRYIAIVDGEDGAYGISFPDAPGCVAMAATFDEVMAAGSDVLAEWVGDVRASGLPVPPPRTAEEIRRGDAEVAELLESGAVIASVPLILDTGRPARANISIDAGLLNAVDIEARRHGVTRSAFLAAAAREKIKASA